MFPGFLLACTLFMQWHKYYGNGQLIGAFEVTPPPRRRTVEQLLALQEAIAQLEAQVQAANIFLLKLRSLLLAAFPQVCIYRHFLYEPYHSDTWGCFLVSEHQQSRCCSCRRCRGIHVRAVQKHSPADFVGSVHEADAGEEEEQRETGEEIEGMVGPDSSSSCTTPATARQQMENYVEIEMSRLEMLNLFSHTCPILNDDITRFF